MMWADEVDGCACCWPLAMARAGGPMPDASRSITFAASFSRSCSSSSSSTCRGAQRSRTERRGVGSSAAKMGAEVLFAAFFFLAVAGPADFGGAFFLAGALAGVFLAGVFLGTMAPVTKAFEVGLRSLWGQIDEKTRVTPSTRLSSRFLDTLMASRWLVNKALAGKIPVFLAL